MKKERKWNNNIKTPPRSQSVSPRKQSEHSNFGRTKTALSKSQLIASTQRLSQISKSAIVDFAQIMDKKTAELNIRSQKLFAIIDLFSLMQSNKFTIRCMRHNNTLTLYCLSDRKTLCANCIYGIDSHRTHKIIPLKNSAKYINEDNEELKNILRQDFNKMEESAKNLQQSRNILDLQLKNTLSKIQNQYFKRKNQLQVKYKQTLSKTKQLYESLITKSINIERKIDEFKMKAWQTLSRIGVGMYSDTLVNDIAIIRQVVTSSLSELTQFQFKKITQKQLERLEHISKF